MPKDITNRQKVDSTASVEWVFYRAVVSMMGFLFLIQCLWANLPTMIFSGIEITSFLSPPVSGYR